jgi:NADPH:quinone reductase
MLAVSAQPSEFCNRRQPVFICSRGHVKAVRIDSPGGPEALKVTELPVPRPGKGEVLIRQSAIGVNFIDIYHRSGLYKLPSYPAILGLEGAGMVEEAGEGTAFKPGERVAYCGGPVGAYAQYRVMQEKFLVKLPDAIDERMAASVMLKGMTAQFLLRRTFPVKPGHTVLIHAAAGGVGLIACQWAKLLGATVIGTVGNDEKAALARENGCDHVIVYTRENIAGRVRELTGGQGVDAVYDSVGKATFMDSLDSLKKFGMLVSFGNASGAIPPFEPLLLSQKGSLYLTRPTLLHHIEDTEYYRAGAEELFTLAARGAIKVRAGGSYALEEAAQAQRDLESRKTTGSLLLIP